jgi:hypothetical protein
MSACFSLWGNLTNFLPDAATVAKNKRVSEETEESVKRARPPQPKKSSRPATLKALEEFISSNVKAKAAKGFERLLPGAELYFKTNLSERHHYMFLNSMVMGKESTGTSKEMLRRFVGQQLMLLTELMVFCVPAYFADYSAALGSNNKKRFEKRADKTKHHKYFVGVPSQQETRAMPLEFARLAHVRDVMYEYESTELFVTVSGMCVPEEHNEKTYFMLLNTALTPTSGLNTACSHTIMQVQTAAKLGRLPSVTSTLLCVFASELVLFNECYSDVAIVDTIYSSLDMLKAAVTLNDVHNNAPPALVASILAAAERKDTLHPYCTIPKLARSIFKHGEEIVNSTKNSINSNFKGVFNVYRAMNHPTTEPVYMLLDTEHKLYQVSWYTSTQHCFTV